MLTICGWSFWRLWHLAAQNGLLDEEDITLLDEGYSEIPGGRHKIQTWLVLELAILLIPCISVFAFYGTTFFLMLFNTAVASTFTLGIICFCAHFFPTYVCWTWSVCVDENFQTFIGICRQKELCLFSLQRSNRTNAWNPLPLRRTRIECLQQLRNFVKCYDQSSRQMIGTPDDAEKLFMNFIGEEMLSLAFPPSCTFRDDKTEAEDETHLQTSALKSLWQCMFLVRSEFLRISLLALFQDIIRCQPADFTRHFGIFFYTLWTTSWLNIGTNRSDQAMQIVKKTSKNGRKNRMAITPLEICKAQLELALERLQVLDESQWPLNEESAEDIVGCLHQIIGTLKSGMDDQAKNSNRDLEDQGILRGTSADEEEMGKQTMGDAEGADKENVDYQIFEFDDQTSQDTMDHHDFDSAEMDSLLSPYGGHNAVMHELKSALCKRKDFCLQRELHALARLRGIPTEAIAPEELDRVPFSSDPITDFSKEKTRLNRGPFGLASLSSTDLNSILAQRQVLFGNREGEEEGLQNGIRIMAMEEYGEEEEENG